MKFLPLVLAQLQRHKLRTSSRCCRSSSPSCCSATWRRSATRSRRASSVAGADRLMVTPQGLAHPAAAASATRPQIEQMPGVDDVDPGDLVRRHLPGPEELLRRRSRSSPTTFLDALPRVPRCRRSRRRPGSRTRTGAIVGRELADRFGWKVGDKIPLQATFWPPKDGGDTWDVRPRRHLRRRENGDRHHAVLLPPRLFDESRLRGTGMIGWYYIRIKDPTHADDDRPKRSTSSSPTRRPRPRPRPRRRFVKGFAKQIGDIGAIVVAHPHRGLLHHPARGRQHHGAVGARAHQRAGGAEGDRLHRRRRCSALVLAESLLIASSAAASASPSAGCSSQRRSDRRRAAGLLLPGRGPRASASAWSLLLGLVTGACRRIQAMRLRTVDALRRELTCATGSRRSRPLTGFNLRTLPQRLGASLARSSASPAWWRCSSACCRSARASASTMTPRLARHRDRAARRRRHRDDERRRRATRRDHRRGARRRARGASGPLASPELFVIVDLPEALDRHRRQRADARRRSRRRSRVRDGGEDRRGPALRAGAATR